MDAPQDLQRGIVAAASDSTILKSLIGDPVRLFDRVPKNAVHPYSSFGPAQEIPDLADCIDGSEIFVQIDVWSQAVGKGEAQAISGAFKVALHEAEIVLQDNRCVVLEWDGTRILDDPDGITTHGVVTFRALTEPTD